MCVGLRFGPLAFSNISLRLDPQLDRQAAPLSTAPATL
jgi:hypothetical protein